MKTGFLPGSFDPPTRAHLALIHRARLLVSRLIVGIGEHHFKQATFTANQRKDLLLAEINSHSADTASTLAEVRVVTFDTLAVAAARHYGASIIIRGVRDSTDYNYESQMAEINRRLDAEIDTVLLCAEAGERALSSGLIKQIAMMNGDLSSFLTENIAAATRAKCQQE